MKAKLLSALVASLFAAGAHAQQGFKVEGSVAFGGLYNSEQPERNNFRLFEYRDLTSGALSQIDLRGRSDNYFVDFYGENIGRSDMYLDLRGQRYGSFRYQVYGDWLTHNITLGAITPYGGAGSTFLNGPLPNFNTATWSSFDYAIDRRNVGGNFEFGGFSPWYFRVDANEVQSKGINVGAAGLGTSPTNGFVELPIPINHNTRNLSAEAGYQSTRGQLSLNWLSSTFSNQNDSDYLRWRNVFFGNQIDSTSLAPDNNYWRIALNGSLRQLPLRSTLSGRVTYSKLTNSVDLLATALNTGGVFASTGPNVSAFDGEVANTTVGLSLASLPARRWDSRVYYNYVDRDNSSTHVTFTTVAGLSCTLSPGAICESERYSYTRHNPGLEVGYRPNSSNRISGGYDYTNWDRGRTDTTKTDEHRVFAQWSNSSLEQVSFRVRYQYLDRDSNFLLGNVGANANDVFFLERFVRRYDVADLRQHQVRLFADYSPIPFLDFALEAYYKDNKYSDTTLGRTKDWRHEYYGSVSYGDPSAFRVTLFGDIEFVNYDAYHRTINASPTCTGATGPNCFDPNTPPTTGAFNWESKNKDVNWMLGLGGEVAITEKFAIKASALYAKTDGKADFNAQTLATGVPAAFLPAIAAYDDTTRTSFTIRGVYQLQKSWELAVGYAYESFKYRDAQYDNYQYLVPATANQTSYLTGAYAFPDYTANIVYGTLRYSFR